MNEEQEFEWDAGRAEANLRKHRISFEAAQRVFKADLQSKCRMWICPMAKRASSSPAWLMAGC
jgi:hypothetical protein